MKKSKLLIPALTVAGVGAVVAPLMTMSSCTKDVVNASTDDIDFECEKHTAVTGGWSLSKATEEYFKDSKYFAQDSVAVFANLLKMYYTYETLELENAEIKEFHASVKNLSIKQTEAKVNSESIANPNKIKGALISGQFDIKFVFAYDDDLAHYESASLLEKVRIENTITMKMSLNECFAFLGWDFIIDTEELTNSQSQFSYNLFGCKNASSNWSMSGDLQMLTKSTFTTKTKDVFAEDASMKETIIQSAKKDNDTSLIGLGDISMDNSYAIPSTYLSKVDWDNSDELYMGKMYNTTEEEPVLSGYSESLTLVNGKSYTLCANVQSSLELNTLEVSSSYGTETIPFKVTSCTLNGNAVTYTKATDNDPVTFSSPLSTGLFKITVTIGGTEKTIGAVSLTKA